MVLSNLSVTRRLAVKMSIFFGLFVALVILFFFFRSSRAESEALEEKFGLALERIVATAALDIDAEQNALVQTKADAARPEFQRIKAVLQRVQQANYLPVDGIYTSN